MTVYAAARRNWTPTATSDGSDQVDGSYMAVQGGSATQVINIIELYIGGLEGTTQAPIEWVVAVDGTVGGGTLAGSITLSAKNRQVTTLSSAPVAFSNASTTKPRRNPNFILATPVMNAFGGIVRLAAIKPEDAWVIVGQSANTGELSLTAGPTPSTMKAVSSHFSLEPV